MVRSDPIFDSTNILVGSSHSDVLMMNFRWSCQWSDFCWSCQWSVRSWLSQRLDSNRVLIRLSRLIRISGLNQFSELTRLPGIDSTLRIDSTDPLIQSSQLNVFLHSFKLRTFDPPLAYHLESTQKLYGTSTYPAGVNLSGRRFRVIPFLLQLVPTYKSYCK